MTGMVCSASTRYIYYSQCSLSDVNKGFARVTGGKINRGTGYGLYIDKLRTSY